MWLPREPFHLRVADRCHPSPMLAFGYYWHQRTQTPSAWTPATTTVASIGSLRWAGSDGPANGSRPRRRQFRGQEPSSSVTPRATAATTSCRPCVDWKCGPASQGQPTPTRTRVYHDNAITPAPCSGSAGLCDTARTPCPDPGVW